MNRDKRRVRSGALTRGRSVVTRLAGTIDAEGLKPVTNRAMDDRRGCGRSNQPFVMSRMIVRDGDGAVGIVRIDVPRPARPENGQDDQGHRGHARSNGPTEHGHKSA